MDVVVEDVYVYAYAYACTGLLHGYRYRNVISQPYPVDKRLQDGNGNGIPRIFLSSAANTASITAMPLKSPWSWCCKDS